MRHPALASGLPVLMKCPPGMKCLLYTFRYASSLYMCIYASSVCIYSLEASEEFRMRLVQWQILVQRLESAARTHTPLHDALSCQRGGVCVSERERDKARKRERERGDRAEQAHGRQQKKKKQHYFSMCTRAHACQPTSVAAHACQPHTCGCQPHTCGCWLTMKALFTTIKALYFQQHSRSNSDSLIRHTSVTGLASYVFSSSKQQQQPHTSYVFLVAVAVLASYVIRLFLVAATVIASYGIRLGLIRNIMRHTSGYDP